MAALLMGSETGLYDLFAHFLGATDTSPENAIVVRELFASSMITGADERRRRKDKKPPI
ncbi:hypothetical protein [Nitrobacter sp.]|uniref:hypothetical protein n=1 Tax=Nitrobacter sp. TaxID=29420 RepID=UPI003F64BFFF